MRKIVLFLLFFSAIVQAQELNCTVKVNSVTLANANLTIFKTLEKYALKMKSWKTATGEVFGNQTIEDAAKGYDIPGFLHRSVGWLHDATALRYTCQMRELLQQMTNEPFFLRHGTFWYRNPEFGKIITEPKKRGRYGRPNPDNFKYNEPNPFHYHGQSLNLS
jgi:hypothetical protein